MDVPPVRPPTMLAPAPVLSRGNNDGPPDEERGGGTATSVAGTGGSRTPAEGMGLAPDASPGVVALLDGWADAASAHTVGVEPLAKGLPRRIRRRADGGLMVLMMSRFSLQAAASEMVGTLLMICAGLMLVASSGELVLMFLGLELVTFPTYLLLYLGRNDAHGQESAAKYFYLSIRIYIENHFTNYFNFLFT